MKKLYQAAAFIFTMIFVSNICSQWIIVSSGGTKDLNSITNYSATLLAVGDSGLVKKSVNLGSTWQTLPFISTVNLTGVFITGVNDAYICGEQGMIYKTSNNGSNWFAQTTLTPGINYYAIDFINNNTGLVIGDNRRFATTANGGTNWITGQLNVPVGANLHYRAVDMYDNTTSYIASTDTLIGTVYNLYVHRSTNSGVSYSNILNFQVGTTNQFVHVQFINSNTGWAITNKGYCIKTINGGNTWTYNLMNMLCESAYFVSAATGYACGTGGGLKKTTNGGVTWLWQNSPTTANLNSIICTDSLTGIAAGFDGVIVKTDNGGTFTAVNNNGNEVPGSFSLNQNYPNPFNPATNISFGLPEGTNVKLAVYNTLGAEVKILANEYLNPGSYEIKFDASNLPSGIYYYKLTAGDFTQTKKMILIK